MEVIAKSKQGYHFFGPPCRSYGDSWLDSCWLLKKWIEKNRVWHGKVWTTEHVQGLNFLVPYPGPAAEPGSGWSTVEIFFIVVERKCGQLVDVLEHSGPITVLHSVHWLRQWVSNVVIWYWRTHHARSINRRWQRIRTQYHIPILHARSYFIGQWLPYLNSELKHISK